MAISDRNFIPRDWGFCAIIVFVAGILKDVKVNSKS